MHDEELSGRLSLATDDSNTKIEKERAIHNCCITRIFFSGRSESVGLPRHKRRARLVERLGGDLLRRRYTKIWFHDVTGALIYMAIMWRSSLM